MAIRRVFAAACRAGRMQLDLTQQQLADALGIHRGHLANIESGRVNVSVDLMERIAESLGQRLELVVHPPRFIAARPVHDTVHSWCSGYVARRLTSAGWRVAREVDVSAGGIRGWIDLLAFDPGNATVVINEVKTRLDDTGGLERQIGWYERQALAAAHRLGWRPRRILVWVLVLASAEVERTIVLSRDVIDQAFPRRSSQMVETLAGGSDAPSRSIALVDPASRRSAWLIRTRLDGRRSPPPYRDYADAARRLGGR